MPPSSPFRHGADRAFQREHSANILEGPKAYPQQDKVKPQNILVADCRGLEFVEFKPDVSLDCGQVRDVCWTDLCSC